jgi:hypothetical protein
MPIVDTRFAAFSATVDKTSGVLGDITNVFAWPTQRRK